VLIALQAGFDALLLECVLVEAGTHHIRRHIPAALRLTVAAGSLRYLYRPNLIGPVLALVMRSSM
jgi:hypothetical protein